MRVDFESCSLGSDGASSHPSISVIAGWSRPLCAYLPVEQRMLVGLIMLNGRMVCMELGVICQGKAVVTAYAAAHVAILSERKVCAKV